MKSRRQMALDISSLPFNRASLEGAFQLSTPDRDPGGDGVWLLIKGGALLLSVVDQQELLPQGACPLPLEQRGALYLGQWQGRPCRLLEVPKDVVVPASLQPCGLRATQPTLPISLLSLGGMALMILHWETTSRYCGNCDGTMVRLAGEWGKVCTQCGAHHFPRIHPCVIGLVIRDDRLLLVSKGEWVPERYGLVAGFVEFGESLEEAMAREVMEETNISITNVRYLGSQSWPFPSQLMCGFVADYAAGEICLNDRELCAAAWFTLDTLPTLPPSRSIARYLIERARDFIRS